MASRIHWDTDDEPNDNLPDTVFIPIENLMYENENANNVTIEDLYNRVPDYLSDRYGYCVFSCQTR